MRAQAEQDEPLFALGVIGILEEQGLVVAEDRLGFLEADAVLAENGMGFCCGRATPARSVQEQRHARRQEAPVRGRP